MGYSAAAPIKSFKLRDKMMDFLKENFRHWKDIAPNIKYNPYQRLGPICDDLSYDHGKCRIGFDFSLSHDYIFAMLRWIALKVGKKRTFKKQNISSCLYIVFDGFEPWPIFLEGSLVPEEFKWCIVDRYGCKIPETDPESFEYKKLEFEKSIYGYNLYNYVLPEMKRLDELWEKQNVLSG